VSHVHSQDARYLRRWGAVVTRRDYVAVAEVIRTLEGDGFNRERLRRVVSEHFANELGKRGANFNRERFLKACEPPVEERPGYEIVPPLPPGEEIGET
jgi:hypothetical protein